MKLNDKIKTRDDMLYIHKYDMYKFLDDIEKEILISSVTHYEMDDYLDLLSKGNER